MQIVSCSHLAQDRVECAICTDDCPIYDCPYLEVDDFDDDDY